MVLLQLRFVNENICIETDSSEVKSHMDPCFTLISGCLICINVFNADKL
jgi:hypothetical protein